MPGSVASLQGILWPFALILTGFVCVQAVLFLRIVFKFNKENNVITQEEIKGAVRTGSISVIGPAISVFIIALSLISLVGPATTFMRVGVIGSASFELNLANIAAGAMNVILGDASFTKEAFLVALFGMVFGSCFYFINTIITLKPMDMALSKGSTKKEGKSFLPVVSAASSMGMIGYFAIQYFIPWPISGESYVKLFPSMFAFISSGVVTLLVMAYIKKSGKKSLNDWILAIGLLAGMITAVGTFTIFGI